MFGNRLTQTPLGLATSKIGTQTSGYTNNRNTGFTYDAAGNQTNDGLHTYVFNAENQITSMDGGSATYAYDGEGRRVKKVISSETTYTFYGPGGVISEFTTSNAIASVTTAASTDKCLYRTSDKLGSAVLVMNSSGLVIENNRTLPYGEAWLAESTPSTNDKKFTTYQRDAESGLDYAMARFNQSTVGRFLSPDGYLDSAELYQPLSWNRYLYTNDDPINSVDPSGNCSMVNGTAHDDAPGDCGGGSVTTTTTPPPRVPTTPSPLPDLTLVIVSFPMPPTGPPPIFTKTVFTPVCGTMTVPENYQIPPVCYDVGTISPAPPSRWGTLLMILSCSTGTPSETMFGSPPNQSPSASNSSTNTTQGSPPYGPTPTGGTVIYGNDGQAARNLLAALQRVQEAAHCISTALQPPSTWPANQGIYRTPTSSPRQ
jgi:RHS repeat-associated protein